ncbi:hypothetical protein [Burkholderia sp. LMG 13014]|uniref:hypothetical protein n=1 Tax=Burkholderia sp. LMG 13014 TaxID=2709306 RepID=UPI0019646219|nr:hypothetical protein [Burkholderia sp. LMG 13014]
MNIDHATNEALNALAALDEDTAERAIRADRAYNEAQDEWIEDWIADNADDPDDDEERDDLRDEAQNTPDYEAFCDQARAGIAGEYGITSDVLDHAIALMNDGDDALALLDQRRAELDPVGKAIAMLAALPLKMLTSSLEAGIFYNEFDDEQLAEAEAEITAELAASLGVDGAMVKAAAIVLGAGRYDDLIERHGTCVTMNHAYVDAFILASLDAATFDRVLAAHKALDEACTAWREDWCENASTYPFPSDNAMYRAFADETMSALATTHDVDRNPIAFADDIDRLVGRVGFDELRVLSAERLIAEGRDPSDAEVVHARAALAALPTDAAMVERVIAAERAYSSSTARWCLDWTYARNAEAGLPEEQPGYTAFAQRLLADLVAEYDVTEAQLTHAVSNSRQYLGHDGLRASHMKRLAPRVAAFMLQPDDEEYGPVIVDTDRDFRDQNGYPASWDEPQPRQRPTASAVAEAMLRDTAGSSDELDASLFEGFDHD